MQENPCDVADTNHAFQGVVSASIQKTSAFSNCGFQAAVAHRFFDFNQNSFVSLYQAYFIKKTMRHRTLKRQE